MNRLPLLSLVLVMTGAVQAAADHATGATNADIRRLQTDVDLLDESLLLVRDDSPRAAEFRQREGEIRDELVWLRGQVRRHRQDDRQGLGASQAEVEEVRRSIVDLRDDVAGTLDARNQPGDRNIGIPDGTEIAVRLDQPISSRTARREDRVDGTVARSVRVDGQIAIPAGSTVRGVVQDVQAASRPSHGGRIDLRFDQVTLPGGRRVDIRSRVASLNEGGIDKKKAGLGAVLGGILGGVIDGTKGAIIGVLVGGGGAVVATKGDDVELPAGTVVNLRLERPVAVVR